MAMFLVFVDGANYGYTADDPPAIGDVITPDTADWQARITHEVPVPPGEPRWFSADRVVPPVAEVRTEE